MDSASRNILLELLSLLLDEQRPGFPEVTPFRLAHEHHRTNLDDLIQEGSIRFVGRGRYSLTMDGMLECGTADAQRVVAECNQVLENLKQCFREDPVRLWKAEEVAGRLGLSPTRVSRRWALMVPEPGVAAGFNADQETGAVLEVRLDERILDLTPFAVAAVTPGNGIPERIARVKVAGFQSFAQAHVELSSLNVLVGANGAGKSNFIHFLQMLGHMMASSLRLWVRQNGSASSLLHGGPKKTQAIAGELVLAQKAGTASYEFALEHVATDELVFAQEVLGNLRPSGMPHDFFALSGGGFESRIPEVADGSVAPDMLRVARVVRNRLRSIPVFHFHDTSPQAAIRLSQNANDTEYLRENGENLAAFLRHLQQSHPRHYRRIVDEVKQVLPDLHDFELKPVDQRIRLNWVGAETGYTLGPHQLSDGSLRAVAIITLLLQPSASMPDVIVMDEPELGLHPHAVGQIGRLLKETCGRCQIIIATQSAQLLSQLDPEDVLVVEKELGGSTMRRLSKQELEGWLDEYDGDLGRLFEMNVTGGAPE